MGVADSRLPADRKYSLLYIKGSLHSPGVEIMQLLCCFTDNKAQFVPVGLSVAQITFSWNKLLVEPTQPQMNTQGYFNSSLPKPATLEQPLLNLNTLLTCVSKDLG